MFSVLRFLNNICFKTTSHYHITEDMGEGKPNESVSNSVLKKNFNISLFFNYLDSRFLCLIEKYGVAAN